MKSQRDFRNYLAGAALAFGIILLTSEILRIIYGSANIGEGDELYSLIFDIYLSAHLIGGFLGGYLVSRVKRSDYIQTGTITAILAYIFEFVYNLIVLTTRTDIYAIASLLIGGIIGAMFFRAKIERERIASAKKPEELKPISYPQK